MPAKTHYKNALQKRIAKTHCKNALQKCIAKTQCKNALQKRSAKTHCKNALQKRSAKMQALPAKNIPDKQVKVRNTLAYDDTKLITAVICFIR